MSRVTIYSLVMLLSNSEPTSCSMSGFNCCFQTCIQVSQETGKVVWYSHPFENFQQLVIHTGKGFSISNEADVNVFLEFPCFIFDPMDVCSLIFGLSALSKYSLNIWKFSVYVLLKPSLKNFYNQVAIFFFF